MGATPQTRPLYSGGASGRAFRLPLALGLAGALAVGLLAGCTPSTIMRGVPPPTVRLVLINGIADGGRGSLSQIVQLGADPAAGRAYLLAGHQIVGPVVSAPWADHLVAIDRTTGTTQWQFGTSTTNFGDHAHRLSGMVVDQDAHRVILAMGQQVVALNAAAGSVAVSVPLPSGLDCVSFPAPTQRPTLDAQGRVLFACVQEQSQPTPVGALVDLVKRTVTIVAPPPTQGIPKVVTGILGHVYEVADDGLRVFAGEPTAGTTPIEELPFNVAGLATALFVETRHDGTPTGRLYLAGIGAQVAILEEQPADASGSIKLSATVLAERAVALTVDPERYRGIQTLPTLPNFLVAPGQYARTFCFGPVQPFAPGSVTTTTAASQSADGTVQVDLRMSVRDAHGTETGSRHWIVAVGTDGTATILTDEGSVNPFQPMPPVPCPV
jgi:hypothetical protein